MHTLQVESITPKRAEEALSTMVSNRAVSDAKVLEYALAMDSGLWSLNGETIKFDHDGRLFDGQHRMRACVLAGKSFRSYVARGIDDKRAFATVDVGKNRSHADVLNIAGFSNTSLLSSIAIAVYLFERGLISWSGVTGERARRSDLPASISAKMKVLPNSAGLVPKDVLLRFTEKHKDDLVEAARFADKWRAPKVAQKPLVGACYYLFRPRSFEEATQFFRDLAEGAGLSRTDPVYHLRERLIENNMAKARLSRWYIFGLVLKAWNKRRANDPMRQLKVGDNEEFPKKVA